MSKQDPRPATFTGSLDERATVALESIAASLVALTGKFAGQTPAFTAGRRLGQCAAKGHPMQPTDQYCQACYLEEHPEAAPKPRGPRSAA